MAKQTIDSAQVKKLIDFRTLHIDKNQTEAAKKMGISQANLSKIESGIRKIPNTLVNTLIGKFGMSNDWWFKSIGKMTDNTSKKSNTMTDIGAYREEVAALQTEVLILNKTLAHIIKVVEKQGKDIEALKNQLHHK